MASDCQRLAARMYSWEDPMVVGPYLWAHDVSCEAVKGTLTYRQLEAHRCVHSTVATEGLALKWWLIQWNLSITTTAKIKFITCDLFSNVL